MMSPYFARVHRITFRCVTAALALCFGLIVVGAVGAEPDPREAERNDYLPIGSTATSLTLMDAVSVAVDHDPAIFLARARALEEGGRLLESSGVFESTIQLSTAYDLESNRLTDGEKALEDGKRLVLRFLAIELQRAADGLRAQLEEGGLVFPDCIEGLEDVEINADGDSVGFDIDALCMDPSERARQELFFNIAGIIDEDEIQRELLEANHRMMEDLADILDEIALRSRETLRRWGPTPRFSDKKTLTFDLSVVRALRNGLVFSPYLHLEGVKDNWRGKRTNTDWGGKTTGDTFRSTVGLNLSIPLGKGRGSTSTNAAESASRVNFGATMNEYVHAISESVLRTSLAYWQVVGAQERIVLLEESAATTRELLQVTENLRRGKAIPEAQLSQMRARTADAEAQLLAARQGLFEVRLGLASAMGLVVGKIEEVPSAEESWPASPDSLGLAGMQSEGLARLALLRRGDMAAMRNRMKSAEILGKAARADMKRRTDLSLSVSYRGLHEGGDITDGKLALKGFQKALFDYSPGPSFKIGFSLDWPFQNNAARGRFLQARSMQHQSQIGSRDLERVTRARIEELTNSIMALTREIAAREESAASYRELVESEVARFRAGVSNVFDAIQTEQQGISEQLALVTARQSLASLVSQLRFEVGALLKYRIDNDDVIVEGIEPLGYTFGT